VLNNWVYRAQPVPYDWVPAGTPHSEQAVVPMDGQPAFCGDNGQPQWRFVPAGLRPAPLAG